SIVFFMVVSFRLLVLGKNWIEPDWFNIPLVFASLLSGTYGVAVAIQILSKYFWIMTDALHCRYESLEKRVRLRSVHHASRLWRRPGSEGPVTAFNNLAVVGRANRLLTSLGLAVLAFRRWHQPRLAIVLAPALVAHARIACTIGETHYVSY